jgi:tetratricopeptide (TPR) repeat protein
MCQDCGERTGLQKFGRGFFLQVWNRLTAVEQPEVIEGHRILDVVGQGACGIVYKALRPDSEDTVALKLLQSTLAGTMVDTLRFEREFRLASTCDHPFLVKAMTYGNFNGRPFYTMELIDGVDFSSRFKSLRKGQDMEAFAKVVEGLLDALNHIHNMGIVHRDLKPENVLVDANEDPRILDFGLAKPQYGDDTPTLTNPGTVLGTINYLSPEQLSARPLDGRADLFSLGTMLYEVLSGKLPFDADHPIGVFGQILSQPPPPLKLPTNFPDELRDLIMKLLNKEPADRYQTAAEALADWRRIMLGVEAPATVRVVKLPEQLYMPRFVGQLQALQAFENILQGKTPRVLLVAGPSGAGKSRFTEECCAAVKARGLSQSGARANGVENTPYQLWTAPLRQAFKRPKPALMPLRSVLSPLLPELGFFKDGATSKSQLFEAMSRALRLQGGLVWLDDSHLGDSASLEFLHYLARSITPMDTLMVVATYHPNQADKLFNRTRDALIAAEFASQCELKPLSVDEIQTMVSSMLGGQLDQASSSVLFSDTSGNPLYTGEAVKAALSEELIEFESGEWRLKACSQRSISNDVRDQLDRQLNSIEEEDFEVLKLAAVIGFEFNFELLSLTSHIPKMELLDRILRVSDKGFLIESEEDCFRFGSRALHQVLVDSVPENDRPALHNTVALALEGLQPRQRWVVDIARHFEAAGQPEKAVTHLLAAGAEASRNFAHQDALDFYNRVLEVPSSQRNMTDATILEYAADARQGLGLYKMAEGEYETLLLGAKATVTQVRLRRKIAECQQMTGDFIKAHENLSEGLALLGIGPRAKASTNKKSAFPLSWVKKTFPQLNSKLPSDDMMSQQIHRLLDRQLSTLFFLRPPAWTQTVLELAQLQNNVAKKLGNPEAAAQAQIFLGFVDLHRGRRDSALAHWDKGITVAAKLRDTPYKALLLRNTGLMHLLAGDATKALELCQITQHISERLGDRPGLTQCHMVCCGIELHWAHFDKALEHARSMLTTADDAGLPVFRALGWSYLARATAHNDKLDEAQQHLAKATSMARELQLPYVDMMVSIARAWVNCDLANYHESAQAVEEGLALCELIEALPFYRLTLRCAALWGGVAKLKFAIPAQGESETLAIQLQEFQEDSKRHGIVQFIGIAGDLIEQLHRQSNGSR